MRAVTAPTVSHSFHCFTRAFSFLLIACLVSVLAFLSFFCRCSFADVPVCLELVPLVRSMFT